MRMKNVKNTNYLELLNMDAVRKFEWETARTARIDTINDIRDMLQVEQDIYKILNILERGVN